MRSLSKQTIVLLARNEPTENGKEEEEMNHYTDSDPYVIRERNRQIKRDVDSLRLEKRLREDRPSSGSRFVAMAKRGAMPLLRAAHLAG